MFDPLSFNDFPAIMANASKEVASVISPNAHVATKSFCCSSPCAMEGACEG